MTLDGPPPYFKKAEIEGVDINTLLFPNVAMPKVSAAKSRLDYLIFRADEIMSMQNTARRVEDVFKYGMIQRLDLDDFLISAMQVYFKGRNPQQIPLPNNAAILMELRENERMVGAIKHDFLGPVKLSEKFLSAFGANLIKSKYGAMRLTTVGVVNQNNMPTAIVHFYPGGGGESGRPRKVILPISNPV